MAAFGYGFGLSRLAMLAAGGTPPAPTPGVSPTTFAQAPAVHYHPHSQTVSVDGNGRLTSLPDMQGLAAMIAVAGITAPKLMTDGLGRKFLRFNGSEAAAIANALVLNNRAFAIQMVGRVHHGRNIVYMVNPRYAAYTSPTVNTFANASIGYLRATVTANSAPFLQAGNPAASSNAADSYKVVPGAQMQVIGIASRTTANGGTRLYINNDKCDVAQQSTSVTGYIGALIGGLASTNNSESFSVSVNNVFDLYELAIWSGEHANAAADAMMAAAVTNYGIAQVDSQLVLAGDSITDGIGTALPTDPAWCGNVGSWLTEPGAEMVPGNVRVINQGTSGNQITDLVTKRDTANTLFVAKYPGGPAKNVVAVQIGRNDMGAGNQEAAAFYSNLVSLISTSGTGYLPRGWRVVEVVNIGTGNATIQTRIEALRPMVIDLATKQPNATFLSDCQAGPGQTYDGLLTVLPVYAITVGGDTKFMTAADAGDTGSGYYNNDFTHLTAEGYHLAATGGDVPAFGYGAIM